MAMADDGGGGGGAGVGVVVGALVVAVAIIGFVVFNGGRLNQTKNVDVNIKAPNISAPAAPAAPSGPSSQ
jgi:hypothetical protein